ncbi:MAG: PEP-CTERM sorting domain-containing protein [Candidatus Zixiibacteriota bacterium]
MTLYQRKYSQPLKWVVALIVFMLVMGITFTDVYGKDKEPGKKPGQGDHGRDRPGHGNGGGNHGNPGDSLPPDDNIPTPTPVPEPGTLILLAGGLGGLYAARRLRKKR